MRDLLLNIVLTVPGVMLVAQDGGRRDDFGTPDWCADVSLSQGSASHCEIREETVRSQGRVDVDAGENGGIAARGWSHDDVHVRARISAHAPTDAEAREIVSKVRLTMTDGRIRAEGPPRDRNSAWSASFEVQAPRGTQLVLNARNGGLNLADFNGTAELRTINGGIAVVDAAGDIRGRTQNGGVLATLSGQKWNGAGLDLETTNGHVSLVLPGNYSAELEAGTLTGGIRSDLPMTVQGSLNRRVRATLGSGGTPIRAVTTNGAVDIRRR